MVIKTKKEDLLKGLQLIIGIITTKNTLPILSNILIQTKENNLELVATDLDVGITTTINSEVVEEGGITVPAKKFTDIIKELPETIVNITTKKNNMVNIECENIFFKITGTPKDEYPKLPNKIQKNKITMQQGALKELLQKAIFAVSHDETRYVLNGVLFTITNNEIMLVATDGRRLVVVRRAVELPKDINIKAVVPTKAIQEVGAIIGEEGQVDILFEENQAMFILNNTTIITRLIEGEFPNYEQAIPKQNKDRLVVDKEKFLGAIKRMALLTTQDSQSVRLDVFKEKLIVSKHSPILGEAKEEVECKYAGSEFFIGFNPTYLLGGLKNIKQQQLTIEFSGPDKPALVKDGDEYLYVVLPMQIA